MVLLRSCIIAEKKKGGKNTCKFFEVCSHEFVEILLRSCSNSKKSFCVFFKILRKEYIEQYAGFVKDLVKILDKY